MFALPDLAPHAWVMLACAAAVIGLSKAALPGINTISIAVFAAVLPAKASTGIVLLLLIVGDVFALLSYRRHADWRALLGLLPSVLAGLALGAVFLLFANDDSVRRVIAVILLCVIALTLWLRWVHARKARETAAQDPTADQDPAHPPQGDGADAAAASGAVPGPPDRGSLIARIWYGTLAGFTTMVANAGGPVMSMYFFAARFQVLAFLGTAAWFFAVINLLKVPVAIGLGLITLDRAFISLTLAPAVIAGAFFGRWVAHRINQRAFEWVVVVGTVVGASYLLIG